MRRHQSSQAGVPKRPCHFHQQPQPGLEMQRNHYQIDQLAASPSIGFQSQDLQAPQQPIQHQQHGHFQYTQHNDVNGNPPMQSNFMANGVHMPPQFPPTFPPAHFNRSHFSPAQFPPADFPQVDLIQAGFTQPLANNGMMTHTPVNHTPITPASTPVQPTMAPFTPSRFAPIQPTGFNINPSSMGFPTGDIPPTAFNKSWPPYGMSSQHAPPGFYTHHEQQTQLAMNRQPQRVASAPVRPGVQNSNANITNGSARNIAALSGRATPTISPRLLNGKQTPLARRSSINVKGSRRHVPKDHNGIDLAELRRSSTPKPASPRSQPTATPIPHTIAHLSPAVAAIADFPAASIASLPAAPNTVAPIIATPNTTVDTSPLVSSLAESLLSGGSTLPPSSEGQGTARPTVGTDLEPFEPLDLAPVPDLEGLEEVREFIDRSQQEEARAAEADAMQNSNGNNAGNGQPMTEAIGPYDKTGYPAESLNLIRPPGCQFRAAAVCIGGWSRYEKNDRGGKTRKRWIVYGVRRAGANGGIEFKRVAPGSSVEEILRGKEIDLSDVQLNKDFDYMNHQQIKRWVGYLLSAVPGINDSVTMWRPAQQSS
ncbi:hypothetical protein GGR51DRAFT_572594 [Nemania sp. FL0031]|nr:hypothetical protein GGR51DRAFT_572594 [Nemania sp. FL0031]